LADFIMPINGTGSTVAERRIRNVAPLFSAPDFLPDSNENC